MSPETSRRLVDVFVLRTLAADGRDEDPRGARQLDSCLALYGVVPLSSYLTADGKRMLCHFHAPDADSLRSALRGARIEYDAVWSTRAQAWPNAGDSAADFAADSTNTHAGFHAVAPELTLETRYTERRENHD